MKWNRRKRGNTEERKSAVKRLKDEKEGKQKMRETEGSAEEE